MAEKINPLTLYTLMVMMVLSGAGLGILLKLQNNVVSKGSKFEHPFIQLFTMFLGEHMCIYVYLWQKRQITNQYGSYQASPGVQRAIAEGMKTDINPLILAIPMCCDFTASTLLLIAYINIPASIAQMMGGFVVFVVAIMSIIFLKRKLYRHHWTGMFLIFAGICMVAATALLFDSSSSDEGNAVIGVSMMVGSILLQGVQYIVEEKLLGSYYLSPMKAVGWEGITGCILCLIVLPILQFVPCEIDGVCNNGKIENSKVAFEQIGASLPLAIFLILNIFMVGGMNGLGMAVTKYATAASRVTLQQSKTVIVWVFFLLYKRGGHEDFYWLQLGGFFVMLIGVVLYNEIAEIPFLGFNMYTKRALNAQSGKSASLNSIHDIDDTDEGDMKQILVNDSTQYSQNSPKAYDYQRNYKRLKDKMENDAGKDSGAPAMEIRQD
jgi:drug/metabolite transporter (DMT)-like permease